MRVRFRVRVLESLSECMIANLGESQIQSESLSESQIQSESE